MSTVEIIPRRNRLLTLTQAEAAYTILIAEAGALDDPGERSAFASYVRQNGSEYRFQGNLGFGGKFRNRHWDEFPEVDCYADDMNAERGAIIARVNGLLREMIERTEKDS